MNGGGGFLHGFFLDGISHCGSFRDLNEKALGMQ